MFREANRPHVAVAEVHFLAAMANIVADGLRRSVLLDQAAAGTGGVGILVLDADDGVTMSNPAAHNWLDALGTGDRPGARLPLAIPAVAAQARALCAPPGTAPTPDTRPARARVRTRNGQWLVVRGSILGEHADAPVAVTLEPARPAELAPLMAYAYGLTPASDG
jgi:PAS domain-containing protein